MIALAQEVLPFIGISCEQCAAVFVVSGTGQIVRLFAALLDLFSLCAGGDRCDTVAFRKVGGDHDGIVCKHFVRRDAHFAHRAEICLIRAVGSLRCLRSVDDQLHIVVPDVVHDDVMLFVCRKVEHIRGNSVICLAHERNLADRKIPTARACRKFDVLDGKILIVCRLGQAIAELRRLIAVADLREREVDGAVRAHGYIHLPADIVVAAVGDTQGSDRIRCGIQKGEAKIFLRHAPDSVALRKLDTHPAESGTRIGSVRLPVQDLKADRKVGGVCQ